ncbi:MAG: maleylpyruvate isomerase family mycothiol-dependent enzyme [Ilumatobacteraceae bacterium]
MTADDFFRLFDDEHERFIAACERAEASAEVPGCPGWTVSDLVFHAYEVQYIWHRVVAERRDAFEGLRLPTRHEGDVAIEVLRGEHAAYTAVLRAAAPETPQWTWVGMRDLGWLARRMAQEFLVHRIDAEQVTGVVGDVSPEFASDGVDEFLTVFMNQSNGSVTGTVHLHCTDVEGEWMVRPEGDTLAVTREHAKGDCAIRGRAVDILLALGRRGPLSASEVIGDAALAESFVAASSLD